jgi:TPR repeat protein
MSLKFMAGALALGATATLAGVAMAGFDEGVAALQIGQYAVALDEWQKSAETGDAKSQYGLGYLYQFGLGTAPDNTQAKAWYEKAAAQNEPDALFALGLMYESGSAGKRDRTEAMVLYSQAAASGHSPDAEYALGRIYLRGQGVPRNEKEGLVWIAKAANDGQPGAQYMLGEAYEVGGTLKQDKVEAYYWYTAALAGDAVVLRETDPEFDPKAALEVLEKHMTHGEIEAAAAKLKKTPPPVPGQSAMATPAKGG